MWTDDKNKKIKCSAPQYIDYVTTYINKAVNDSSIFPTKHGEWLKNQRGGVRTMAIQYKCQSQFDSFAYGHNIG